MLLIRFLSHLPLSVLYLLSNAIYVVGYYGIRYRLKTVRRNLANAFPELSEKERRSIEKKFYQNLSDYIVESLKLYSMPEAEFRKRCHVVNPEIIQQKAREHGFVLLLGSHSFNWEWELTSTLLQCQITIDFVFQKQKNKTFDTFLLKSRSRFGGSPVYRESVARELLRKKGVTQGLIMASDQYPGRKGDKKVITRFLNQDTKFFEGMNQIAKLMQACVLYIEIRKLRRGYYQVQYYELTVPPYDTNAGDTAIKFAQALERNIQQDPASWLWSHKRWRAKASQPTP